MKLPGQTVKYGCCKSQAGFTLLEVIVAGSILAVGLSSILTLYSSALKGMAQTRGYEEARLTAQSMMSQILFESPKIPFQRSGTCTKPVNGTWEAMGEPDDLVPTVGKITIHVRFQTSGTQRKISLVTSQADMMLPGNQNTLQISKGG